MTPRTRRGAVAAAGAGDGRVVRMRKRIALLVLLGALAPAAHAQFGVPLNCLVAQHNGDCDLYGISLVQLLANPEKYDGRHVRVSGYIHFEKEASAIFLHEDDVEHHLIRNGVWVSLAEGESLPECQDAYVEVEGVYRARNTGKAGLFSGALTRVTKCQKIP